MKRVERSWMYERYDENKRVNLGFANGVVAFIEHAKSLPDFTRNFQKLRCPCVGCDNTQLLNEYEVKSHLIKRGFVPNYYYWFCHGEDFPVDDRPRVTVRDNPFRELINDALRDEVDAIREEALNADEINEAPNPQVKAFFEMLNKADEPLYEGSPMSVFEAASRLVTLKCDHNLSHRVVDGINSLLADAFPKDNKMTSNFYGAKKLLKGLQLPHQKIDACNFGCMLFWEEDEHLDACRKCGLQRYKANSDERGKRVAQQSLIYFPLAPRLQRLYATKHIAEQMRWHAESRRVADTMIHPSDSEAWKHFDARHPDFASETRNVRLGLCTDGFAPFAQFGKPYSCWPVMLTPYNLPPSLCLKKPFIFLSLIVPGPKNPKKNLDVYLQPLVKELRELWEIGVFTYDVSTKQNFQLRAALFWTVNDFPAYGMLSGWSTAGGMACPYCANRTKSFWLKHSGKWSWFDCHRHFLESEHPFRKDKNFLKSRPVEVDAPPHMLSGEEVWKQVEHLPTVVEASEADLKELKAKKLGWWKRSIFWDLPYWRTLLIRHNFDVMHIEKNFFEQTINTIMNDKNKTCYGPKGKLDLVNHCRKRSDPKFVLEKQQRKALCEWVTKLKFPDGYASNLSRCVDVQNYMLRGMKSHDCHVFMERLLPIALRELIPNNEWKAFTEISQFFRDLCATQLKMSDVNRLEANIPVILCKLEKILPPSFFNSMEHLPIHLPYELKLGGPVQYRWMYPFERFLNHLKRKIGNKAHVEGSICNAYLLEEISNFCSVYYKEHVDSKVRDLDIGSSQRSNVESQLPEVFTDHGGSTTGKCRTRLLNEKEYNSAHKYVLSNCEILKPYELMFENFIILQYPGTPVTEIWSKYDSEFPKWFMQQEPLLKDDLLKALSSGPSKEVRTWKRYSINGYNFRTFNSRTDIERTSINNGVCVTSVDGADYYGSLEEVLELKYIGSRQLYTTVLFKCDWLDNSDRGMKIHKEYKIVEIHRGRKYPMYEPFVLSYQVDQVCYAPYPSLKRDKEQWRVVFKTKAKTNVDDSALDDAYQEAVVTNPTELSDPTIDEEVEETNIDVGQSLNDDNSDDMSHFIVEEDDDIEEELEAMEGEEFEESDDNTDEDEEEIGELFPDDDGMEANSSDDSE